jgi:hypothetical protein
MADITAENGIKNSGLVSSYCLLLKLNDFSAQKVPYRSVLQERIEPGQTLQVKGVAADDAKRF